MKKTLENPLDYSKIYSMICNSIFHRTSSYSLIKAIALGMGYEEEKAGRLWNTCQDCMDPIDVYSDLFCDTWGKKTGFFSCFG